MRYLLLVAAVAVAVCTNMGWAVEQVDQRAEKQKAVTSQDKKLKEIDLGNGDEMDPAIGYGEGDRRVMQPWEEYDENTGLPDEVESDVDETIQ
jgi:NAD/NADP transhydrogenase alpha subunit